jgi:hypothetical protein
MNDTKNTHDIPEPRCGCCCNCHFRLFEKEEIAERLRISERHLQTLTKRELIPVIMLGDSVRYDLNEVRFALKKLTIHAR